MRIIYVDDELPALDNFRLTTANFVELKETYVFQDGREALEFARQGGIDAAFLDMEMPGIHGLELAKELKALDPRIRVIFVTAYTEFALDAWGVDATGYLLKPYTAADIRKELAKCSWKALPSHRVVIETIPSFSITVDGIPLHISGTKTREMLALLVDRGERGVTVGEAISCIWPERTADAATQSLYRMTYKRLADALENAGIGHIIAASENRRYLKVDEVDCDLYRLLGGDPQTARIYRGAYLQEYDWAEERNGQLHWMMNKN
ncbi:MAG: response regulator [Firmicutes bacterium]|nr:response regulator [Bacillota bacterium]